MAVRRYGKMFFFSTAFMLASLHIAGWMGSDRSFSIQRVEVIGCEILQSEEVKKAANIPFSTPIMQLDLRAVQQRIEQMPMVKSVSLARQFPATIAIRIEEVQPIVLFNNNGLHPIDELGSILPTPHHFKILDLPVLSGSVLMTKTKAARLNHHGLASIEYFAALRKYNSALYHDISEARLDSRGGLVLYLMEEAVPVLMGKEQWLEKSERLLVVMQHLKTQTGKLKVAEFDLRFAGQVIARNKT